MCYSYSPFWSNYMTTVSFERSIGNTDCTVCLEKVTEYWAHGEPIHPACKSCFETLASQPGELKCPTCRGRITSIQGESVEAFQSRIKGQALCDALQKGDRRAAIEILTGRCEPRDLRIFLMYMLEVVGGRASFEEIPEGMFPNGCRHSEKLLEALLIHLDKIRERTASEITQPSLIGHDQIIFNLLCSRQGYVGRIMFNSRYAGQPQDALGELVADHRFADISPEILRRAFHLSLRYNHTMARILENSSRSAELPGFDRFSVSYAKALAVLCLSLLIGLAAGYSFARS